MVTQVKFFLGCVKQVGWEPLVYSDQVLNNFFFKDNRLRWNTSSSFGGKTWKKWLTILTKKMSSRKKILFLFFEYFFNKWFSNLSRHANEVGRDFEGQAGKGE